MKTIGLVAFIAAFIAGIASGSAFSAWQKEQAFRTLAEEEAKDIRFEVRMHYAHLEARTFDDTPPHPCRGLRVSEEGHIFRCEIEDVGEDEYEVYNSTRYGRGIVRLLYYGKHEDPERAAQKLTLRSPYLARAKSMPDGTLIAEIGPFQVGRWTPFGDF